MSYEETYTNRRFFSTVAVIMLLGIVLASCVGCGRAVDQSGNDPQSSLSKAQAFDLAQDIAAKTGGHVRSISREHYGNSMGKVISRYSFYVVVNSFDTTQVNDIIVYRNNGGTVIHQVIARGNDAMKTAGMNNSLPDKAVVFRDNYIGTLVSQVYYREAK